MGCCGNNSRKSGSRKAKNQAVAPQNAISQNLANQLRLQNGQSITPIKKRRPQYQYM